MRYGKGKEAAEKFQNLDDMKLSRKALRKDVLT
jgi:hypothetical protein